MEESRTGSALLLDIEAKISTLLEIAIAQDLSIKILSNKLNSLNAILANQANQANQGQKAVPPTQGGPMIEAVDTSRIMINSENIVQVETSPVGFRRTSRADTYEQPPAPVQPVKAEIIVPTPEFKDYEAKPKQQANAVPVIQQVVDKNNKSLFLANVEIIDLATNEMQKTRTNGVGKWSRSLTPGNYKVIIKKQEKSTGQYIDMSQEITVTGEITPYTLPNFIFK